MARWLIPLFLLSTAALAEPWKGAATWTGKVVGVSDGDTIQVMLEGKAIKVRLYGVDAPEKDQPFGQKAKQFTSQLVFGKEVKVEVKDTDHWGRVVARVFFAARVHRATSNRRRPFAEAWLQRSLELALVDAGLAWWYRQFAAKETPLANLEAGARKAKRGLWADANPTPPWEWRKGKRAGHQLGVLKGTMVGDVHGTPAVDVTHPVVGNIRSKVYHWFTCPDLANCKHCSATFSSKEEAKAAGYRPHQICVNAGESTECKSPPGPPCPNDETCRSDRDCAKVAKDPCACPPCFSNSVWVVNRQAAKRWARIKVKCPAVNRECAKCPVRLEPTCVKGTPAASPSAPASRCAVREIRL